MKTLTVAFMPLFNYLDTLPKLHQDCNQATHTYPHKPQRTIKLAICNHQDDSSFYLWAMPVLVICKQRKEYIYSHT